MNWVDYSFLLIIAVSVAISIWRGFTKEAFSLAGWIIAFWVALTFAADLDQLLNPHIAEPSMRLAVGFAILFLMTLLLAGLVNYLAVQLIKKTGLSGTDRMIGIVFGIGRGVLVIGILVLIGGLTPLPQDSWWQQSALMHYFQDIAIWLRNYLPAEIASNIRY